MKIHKGFTKTLMNKINNGKKIKLYIDGPYGGSMIDINDQSMKAVMFISGGVGITPILSFAKFYLYQIKKGRKI